MNHYLLPGSPADFPGNATRGFTAIPLLIQAMINRNARIEHFEAKIFGGCNSVYRENDLYKIGDRNAAIALTILDEYRIPVTAQHIGGSHGRKIVFNTATGKVRMRLLPETVAVVNEKIHKGLNN
jgi:chemotaxis protein CheD